jgi:hypothetical protein
LNSISSRVSDFSNTQRMERSSSIIQTAFMDTPINLFVGRTAVSRALSFLAYQFDMSRHSLVKLLAIRLSPQAGKSMVMRGSLRFIPTNKFLNVSIAFSRVREAAVAQ